MSDKQSIQSFVQTYFEKLGAVAKLENNIINISSVPSDFEKFVGKTSPYKLGFDINDKQKDPDIELINLDSFFLKAMRDYVKEKGKTTLIKIDFSQEAEKNLKFDITLANSQIYKQSLFENFKLFKKFTFQLSMQYLSQKEVIIKDFYIKDNQLFNFQESKYNLIQGKKEDISFDNVKEDYQIAKNEMKNATNHLIEKEAAKLQNKLEKEIERINRHSLSVIAELQDKINKNEDKILFHQQELSQAITQREKSAINSKIEKLKEKNSLLNQELNNDRLSKEKEIQIKDEERKHSLDVFTKLLNTTLIYYPIYNVKVTIKNNLVTRDIILTFDPLLNIKEDIHCENCLNKIKNLYICSSGHINCEKCLKGCNSCRSELCEKCFIKTCNICSNKICKKCALQCDVCWKTSCKSHINIDNIHSKNLCSNCSKKCDQCNKFFIKSFVSLENNGKSLCNSCKANQKVKEIFK